MAINRLRRGLQISKKRILILSIIAALVVGAGIAALRSINRPVIDLGEAQSEYLYLPTGSTFDDVVGLLRLKQWLTDEAAFCQMAKLMKYGDRIRAGRYRLTNHMTARQLVGMLRSGNQAPVNVTFNNVRTMDQLSAYCARNIEADSADLHQALMNTELMTELGYTAQTYPAMFVPNTYQFLWNTTAEEWLRRMKKEHDAFWNEQRRHKADSLGLSPNEVSTLASIIDEETNNRSEMPIIAGLYLNRLRIGMPMQACPTIKYAIGDFTIHRVLSKYLEVESAYNTYKHRGLPPGPIRIASPTAIDAVLNAQPSQYLYMCAKADGSGTHRFAATHKEHQRNAEEYQRELNKKKIYK